MQTLPDLTHDSRAQESEYVCVCVQAQSFGKIHFYSKKEQCGHVARCGAGKAICACVASTETALWLPPSSRDQQQTGQSICMVRQQ